LIHDRDAKFGLEVFASVKSVGRDSVRTSFRSPWQNGVANAGLKAAVGIYWIMSLPSMSAI